MLVAVNVERTLGAKLLAPTLSDLLRTDSSELDDFMWKSVPFFSPLRSSPLSGKISINFCVTGHVKQILLYFKGNEFISD